MKARFTLKTSFFGIDKASPVLKRAFTAKPYGPQCRGNKSRRALTRTRRTGSPRSRVFLAGRRRSARSSRTSLSRTCA